jgi:hypothetical protein
VIIRNAAGFRPRLHEVPGEVGPLPEFPQFGFRLPEPAEVCTLLGQLTAGSAEIIEQLDEPATCPSNASIPAATESRRAGARS